MIDFIYENIPSNDPIAVVDTYHNAWWDDNTWPANSYTGSLNCDNISYSMEVHRLALMKISVNNPLFDTNPAAPIKTNNMAHLSSIPAILKTRPIPAEGQCSSAQQVPPSDPLSVPFPLLVSLDKDPDDDWIAARHRQGRRSNINAILQAPPQLSALLEDNSDDIVTSWRAFSKRRNDAKVHPTPAPTKDSSPILSPVCAPNFPEVTDDLDDDWQLFTKRRENRCSGTIPPTLPLVQKSDVSPLPNVQAGIPNAEELDFDLDNNWRSFSKSRCHGHSASVPSPSLPGEVSSLTNDSEPALPLSPVPPSPVHHEEVWWTSDHDSVMQSDSDEDILPPGTPSRRFTLPVLSTVQRLHDAAYFDTLMDNNIFDDIENEIDAEDVEL